MRMLNRYIVAAAIAGLCCGFSVTGAMAAKLTCEPSRLAEKYPSFAGKTITIGQDGESPPFSLRDPKNFDQLIGLDADTAQQVFACAGIPIKFVTGNWSGLIPAVVAGKIDLMWDTLLYTPERAKGIDFVYYMNAATGFIVAAGNPHKISTPEDFCGLTATAGLGTTQEAMLHKTNDQCVAAGKPAINIVASPDIPSGMRLIQNGRADVAATNKFLAGSMAASNPAVEMAFGVTTGAKLAVGVTKGNKDLVQAISDGLTVLRANGGLKQIFDKYKVDYSLVVDPQVLTQ
jgi:polar amino acid transport system substrate-binding protein